MLNRPRLLITMGDAAGIGPEIIVRAWPQLNAVCAPIVVGDVDRLRWAQDLLALRARIDAVQDPQEAQPHDDHILCLQGSKEDLSQIIPGRVSAAAGRAAYDWLCTAIDLTQAGAAAGIVTAPLHKEGLRAAGLLYPGHTEILAERTGTRRFAMMLYGDGLGVIHVTLHVALRDVFARLSQEAIHEKIHLLHGVLLHLLGRKPRIGVAALNPHASDGGLFGDEEAMWIQPAVARARADGIEAAGPFPSDTLFVRARSGEFDGIVAMYHDQGHIALKLLAGMRAVNISVGLPLLRTSVAHGTAYDIAGRGMADPTSLVEAARVAAKLAASGYPHQSLCRMEAAHEDGLVLDSSRSHGSQPGPAARPARS
ncbi:MAG TPA: 4-hydroxythreonine-4-phosphate dehydrogenase PdxA [Gemmataceae bacterium]|nr:4-hydroxythreonine-4-phosphate dehydrogenase PdxA [Gemmataceae bacterium]